MHFSSLVAMDDDEKGAAPDAGYMDEVRKSLSGPESDSQFSETAIEQNNGSYISYRILEHMTMITFIF